MGYSAAAAIAAAGNAAVSNQQAKSDQAIRNEKNRKQLLEKQKADDAKISYQQTYQQITLTVHSSLEAVGLTAAFSKKLTEHQISANVVAGYYHDHIFVQSNVANKALAALTELQLG